MSMIQIMVWIPTLHLNTNEFFISDMFGSSPLLPPGVLPPVATLAASDSGFYSHGNSSSVQAWVDIFNNFYKLFSTNYFRIPSVIALWQWTVSQIWVGKKVWLEETRLGGDSPQMLICQTMEAGAVSRGESSPWWIAPCPPSPSSAANPSWCQWHSLEQTQVLSQPPSVTKKTSGS